MTCEHFTADSGGLQWFHVFLTHSMQLYRLPPDVQQVHCFFQYPDGHGQLLGVLYVQQH